MRNSLVFLLIALVMGSVAAPSPSRVEFDPDLTNQIAEILRDCHKVTPGKTRANLLRLFTTEGGLSMARSRTYVYHRCPYIKVDVQFTLSSTNQSGVDEQPTDTIRKISRPYLAWGIAG